MGLDVSEKRVEVGFYLGSTTVSSLEVREVTLVCHDAILTHLERPPAADLPACMLPSTKQLVLCRRCLLPVRCLAQDGITAVADPEPTLHTSATAKAYAHILRDFINRSDLPAWDKRTVPSNGFWRLVVVREVR